MTDWSNPDPFQLKLLHEALLFAYPEPSNFNTFLSLYFGRSYAQLAPMSSNYHDGMMASVTLVRAEGWLTDLVRSARQDKPRSPKLLMLDANLELTRTDVPTFIGRSLEDIIRSDGKYQDLMPWVEKLVALAGRTCRIEYPLNTPCGTGWLVGPDLLLTNWHIIRAALPGGTRNASEYVCRFDYAVTAAGTQPGVEVRFAEDWCVDFSPASSEELGEGAERPDEDTLDYALIRLAAPVGAANLGGGRKRGWVPLSTMLAPQPGSILFTLQHPQGQPLKLAPGAVAEVSADGLRLFHTCNTQDGSSGSIVLNAQLEPVGLHHAGDSLYRRGKIGTPERNQAVPMTRIVTRLRAQGHLH